MSQRRPRAKTWAALIERFAAFKALPCVRSNGRTVNALNESASKQCSPVNSLV